MPHSGSGRQASLGTPKPNQGTALLQQPSTWLRPSVGAACIGHTIGSRGPVSLPQPGQGGGHSQCSEERSSVAFWVWLGQASASDFFVSVFSIVIHCCAQCPHLLWGVPRTPPGRPKWKEAFPRLRAWLSRLSCCIPAPSCLALRNPAPVMLFPWPLWSGDGLGSCGMVARVRVLSLWQPR